MDNKKLILFIVVFILLAGEISFWYWQKKSSTPAARSTSQTQTVSQTPIDQKTANISLGSQILQKTQNPAKDKLPETNPFQIETNPLKAQYINPF